MSDTEEPQVDRSFPARDGQAPPPLNRWHLIRDALQFQIKLAIDGVRDLILIPLSALGALLSLLGVRDTPLEFYNIVRWGKRTERAIDLFSAARQGQQHEEAQEAVTVDSLLARVESLVVEQHSKGGITATAKQAIDRALDGLEHRKQS